MKTSIVKIEKPDDVNFILGQSHFIKTVEDIYEAMVNSVPGAKFGIAFCEASGDRKLRFEGTDPEMLELARKNALAIGAGHSFIVFMRGCYPVNVLNAIKMVPEVCGIFCASANPVEVVVAESEQGRGILGVIDGQTPFGVEDEKDKEWRKSFLRKIGYKP
ncbi:MAG: adenosine-specific kinase [Euryarchaeota archaeon]|nr:adenosine-specific kinase [Euryarchaeota archaeon]